MNTLKKTFLALIFSVIFIVPTFADAGLYYLNHVGDDDICLVIGVTGNNPKKDFSYLMGISFIDKEGNPHIWYNYDFLRPNSYWERVSGKWVFTGTDVGDEVSSDLEDNNELLGYWYDSKHGKYFVGEVSPITDTFSGMWLNTFDDVLDAFATFAYMKYYALKTNNKVHLTRIEGSYWYDTNEIAYFMDYNTPSNSIFVRDGILHYSDGKTYRIGNSKEAEITLSDGKKAYLLNGWLMLDGRAVVSMVDPGNRFRYSYCTNMDIWEELKKAGEYIYVNESSPAWRDLGHLSNDLPMGYFVVPKGAGSPMGSMSRKPNPEKIISVCQIPVKRYATLRVYPK